MKPIYIILAALTLLTTSVTIAGDSDLKTLTARAEGRDVKAQVDMVHRYRDGKSVEKDIKLAMQWAHRAADARNSEAMDFVGHAYLRGADVNRNPVVATPGLQLITAADLKNFWRSDYYGARAKTVLSRPAFVIERP